VTAPTIEPGTRCECNDTRCPHADAYPYVCGTRPYGRDDSRTYGEAVRLVTVPDTYSRQGHHTGHKQVPMCAPCAEYHDQKGVGA